MTKQFGVDWAPLNVPLKRRLQTTAVFVTLYILLSPAFSIGLYFYLLLFTRVWYLMLLYLVWMIYDQDAARRGARPLRWLRNLHTWKKLAEYFPAALEKTTSLDRGRRYIFACHPHGIVGLGFFISFGTNGTHFVRKFPEIKRLCMATLGVNFWFPFRREILLWLGMVEASKDSIRFALCGGRPAAEGVSSSKGESVASRCSASEIKDSAVVIVVGGAREALEARPGNLDLILKRRKGFVKMALKCGADLVPVFSFGENDMFQQVDAPEGSTLRKFQLRARSHLSFSLPLFYGRGIFNYTLGLMPFRHPLHTIVGRPIAVEQDAEPSAAKIDEVHRRYLSALTELFEANKCRFGLKESDHLNFV